MSEKFVNLFLWAWNLTYKCGNNIYCHVHKIWSKITNKKGKKIL